ncbi:MAG: hypothetical protein JEZ04_15590 [Spirochaetales bacterium]|nr:hypothetical protein [Spirochaetales bacterium]
MIQIFRHFKEYPAASGGQNCWVNHTFAYILLECGYNNAQQVAEADGDEMYTRVRHLNEERQIFKANIGRHDIQHCIDGAKPLPHGIQY